MNKLMILPIYAAFLVAFLAVGLGVASEGDRVVTKQTYKIGVINSLSGGFSIYAVDFQKGIDLAVHEINSEGGINGHPVEIIVRDDESDAKRASNYVRDLAQAGSLAIVGFADFGLQKAAAPVVEEMKIPTIQLAPIDPPYVQGGYNFGGIWWTIESATLARLVAFKEMGFRKVAHFAPKDPVGEINEILLRQIAPEVGVEIVATEWMLPTDTEVASQLLNLKAAKPDVIFNNGSGEVALVQYKNLLQIGWKIPMVCNDANTTHSFIEAMGDNKDLILAVGSPSVLKPEHIPPSHPKRDQLIEFSNKYRDKYGTHSGSGAAQGYDAIRSLFPILEKTKLDPSNEEVQVMRDRIRDELENQCFQGLDWKVCRTPENHKGAQEAEFLILRIEGGHYVPATKEHIEKLK